MQRHAPSWLEQLPQLPDVMLDNLQQARENELALAQQQQRVAELQQQSRRSVRRHRRYLVAALACLGAAIAVVPGAWQQLAAAPLVAWLLGGLAIALLWPRDS